MRLSMDEVRKQHDGIKKLYEQVLDLFDTIESLQLENERLADETIKLMKENAKNSNKKDELVKVLKQAREVLYNLKMDDYPGFSAICEALAEIDKVMGGKDDERKPV